MKELQLGAILSIDNLNASYIAVSKHPCLIVLMFYKDTSEPIGLTFIARPFEEDMLLNKQLKQEN